MIWPWRKHRADTAEARRRARAAEVQQKVSTSRREEAEHQAIHSEQVSGRLRAELDRDGWTDLLQAAWKGR